jgi:hypothetical protein
MFCGNFFLISFDRFNRHLQLKRHSHQKEKTAAAAATSRNHHSQMKNERERSIDPSINPHDSTITTA